MEVSLIKDGLEELRNLVTLTTHWLDKSKQQEKDALESLLSALNETMIYLGRAEELRESNCRETEEGIARLWKQAAISVRPYNQELAKKCNAKGLYWGHPSYFTQDEIEKMQISIRGIQLDVNKAIQSV